MFNSSLSLKLSLRHILGVDVRKYIVLALCSSSIFVHAGSSSINPGSSMSMGASSNHHSLSSALNNPAMNSLVIKEDENWRLSFLPTIAFNLELGQVDDFADDLDELIDIIDDPNSTTDSVTDTLDRFNQTLVKMGESGYLKSSLHIDAPFLPLAVRSDVLGGTLGLGLSMDTQIALRILDDDLSFDEQNGTFSTATSLYIKSGIAKKLSLSYSRSMLNNIVQLTERGTLYGGVKLNVISLDLSKQVTQIQQLDGQGVEDVVEDEYDNNLESTTNVGIDLGLVWDTPKYRLGLVFENLNSPEFDYGTIGEDCATREENSLLRTNCEVAAEFIQNKGTIKAREAHTMHAYTRVDALYKLNERWLISSTLDLASYEDVVGFENQWAHLATSYNFKNNIIPSLRIGYQQNLAGDSTSSLAFGATILKYFSLDFEWGLESVSVDDSSAPRRFGFSFSVQERF
ncbi:MAG: hypothetical protein ACI93R_002518 [Flavobacteriales bacterium]|jgi:hypothetical protein